MREKENEIIALEYVKNIHGEKFNYELVIGSLVDLTKLKNNQKVCGSKIKGHHILITEK